MELRGFEPLTPACHRGIPAAMPTTKPCVAGHCTSVPGQPYGGLHRLVWLGCCASAAWESRVPAAMRCFLGGCGLSPRLTATLATPDLPFMGTRAQAEPPLSVTTISRVDYTLVDSGGRSSSNLGVAIISSAFLPMVDHILGACLTGPLRRRARRVSRRLRQFHHLLPG